MHNFVNLPVVMKIVFAAVALTGIAAGLAMLLK
jgi:hypothetical protein